jgi:hypothetical protein
MSGYGDRQIDGSLGFHCAKEFRARRAVKYKPLNRSKKRATSGERVAQGRGPVRVLTTDLALTVKTMDSRW